MATNKNIENIVNLHLKDYELIEIITDQTDKIEKIDELVRISEKQGRTTVDINKLNEIL